MLLNLLLCCYFRCGAWSLFFFFSLQLPFRVCLLLQMPLGGCSFGSSSFQLLMPLTAPHGIVPKKGTADTCFNSSHECRTCPHWDNITKAAVDCRHILSTENPSYRLIVYLIECFIVNNWLKLCKWYNESTRLLWSMIELLLQSFEWFKLNSTLKDTVYNTKMLYHIILPPFSI